MFSGFKPADFNGSSLEYTLVGYHPSIFMIDIGCKTYRKGNLHHQGQSLDLNKIQNFTILEVWICGKTNVCGEWEWFR